MTSDSGRGLASRTPALSEKSRRTVLFGMTVMLFVEGSCVRKEASNGCEPLPAKRT